MAGRCASRRGAFAAARQVAASAPGLVRGPSPRRSGLHGIGRSRSLPASGSGCRGLPEGHVGDPGDRSHHGPDATAASVHGGSGISPRESHRRTTGGVTLHAAAAWRIEVTSASLTGTDASALCRPFGRPPVDIWRCPEVKRSSLPTPRRDLDRLAASAFCRQSS